MSFSFQLWAHSLLLSSHPHLLFLIYRGYSLGFHQENDNGSMRLTPKSLKLEFGLSKKGCYPSGARKCGVIQASNSQIYVVDPVLSPTNKNAAEPWKKSSKFVLS